VCFTGCATSDVTRIHFTEDTTAGTINITVRAFFGKQIPYETEAKGRNIKAARRLPRLACRIHEEIFFPANKSNEAARR
jgi:hypothetical protein